MQYPEPIAQNPSSDEPPAASPAPSAPPLAPVVEDASAPKAAASGDMLSANLEALDALDGRAPSRRDAQARSASVAAEVEAAEDRRTSGSQAAAPANAARNDGEDPSSKTPKVDPPRVSLIPFTPPSRPSGPRAGAFRRLRWGVAAAALALVVAGGAAVVGAEVRSRGLKIEALQESIAALQARIAALETAKPNDETAAIRKAVGDARGGLASSRDLSSTILQVNARIDRLEHDQDGRLDKLVDRLDRETAALSAEGQSRDADLSARLDKLEHTDFAARLDKLETKSQSTVVAVAPTGAAAPPASTSQPGAATAAASNEIVGSVPRPQPSAPIRGWVLLEIRNGVALVENRQGLREISLGQTLAGAGRVQRFERHGRQWVVVTDQGVIVPGPLGGYREDANLRPPALIGGYGAYYGRYGDGEY